MDFQAEATANVKVKGGANVNVDATANLELKANVEAKMQGTAMVTIKGAALSVKGDATAEFGAGGPTIVKGLPVMIN